ncbi:hypothetical protein HN51_054388, partial [Arachis hypogaea]
MSIWKCCELLDKIVDETEAIRKDYSDEDWLHLTGFIHDLDKVLLFSSFGELPQWAIVDLMNPMSITSISKKIQNTKYGIYSEKCGLNNVAKGNKTTLPSVALFIIRYHSFY